MNLKVTRGEKGGPITIWWRIWWFRRRKRHLQSLRQ